MQINAKDPQLLAALNARLTKELGDTFAANLALDLIGDAHMAAIEQLRAHNAALTERTTNDQKLIEELRAKNEELRGLARPARPTRTKD
ncbi:hypothetical protein [Rhodoblastus sp.]|uniref:hypothetical protein n=1 Tax=Rhodoblastus sp. TaxID=1962975 RepID=UPI003F972E6B